MVTESHPFDVAHDSVQQIDKLYLIHSTLSSSQLNSNKYMVYEEVMDSDSEILLVKEIQSSVPATNTLNGRGGPMSLHRDFPSHIHVQHPLIQNCTVE